MPVGPSPDQTIRDSGFVIFARPEGVEPRWRRGRLIYTHSDALKIAREERRQALEAIARMRND